MKQKIIVKARFIPQAKTLAEWENENPILLAGEHGVVTDSNGAEREKIGDGVTPWKELCWWKGLSAYEIAVNNGFEGSEQEWLESLKGETGKIGTDKTATGINILSIAEEGVLADIKFTSTAPQNTKVRIYNENCVDENILVGKKHEGVEYDDQSITIELVNIDSLGNEYSRYISNFSEFVFDTTINSPPEYASYVESLIRVSSPKAIDNIPLPNMVEGNTYMFKLFINCVDSGRDMDGNVTNWDITYDKTYLLNKDNSAVETVNADGSISTANIKPYTIAMFDDLTGDEAYYLDLSYVVSDFVTKAYVDNLVDDTKAYVDTLVGDIETLLGGI